MNINGLFESLNQYINWMENAQDTETISHLFSSFLMLFQFLFAFIEWGMI